QKTAILRHVTSAVENPGMAAPHRVATLNRPNMVSVGTIVFLSQELMFFAGLFAMYFVSKSNSGGNWPSEPAELNVPFAATLSIVPSSSRVTAQFGVCAAERADLFARRRWYALSALLGTVFLIGQGYECFLFLQPGTTREGSVYGSVLFIATGVLGAHVLA